LRHQLQPYGLPPSDTHDEIGTFPSVQSRNRFFLDPPKKAISKQERFTHALRLIDQVEANLRILFSSPFPGRLAFWTSPYASRLANATFATGVAGRHHATKTK